MSDHVITINLLNHFFPEGNLTAIRELYQKNNGSHRLNSGPRHYKDLQIPSWIETTIIQTANLIKANLLYNINQNKRDSVNSQVGFFLRKAQDLGNQFESEDAFYRSMQVAVTVYDRTIPLQQELHNGRKYIVAGANLDTIQRKFLD